MPSESEFQSLAQSIRDRLTAGLRASTSVVRALTAEEAQILARRLHGSARGVKEIDEALRRLGLVPMLARACGYAPFSRQLANCKSIAVIPYTSSDPKANVVGGMGISDGETASAVVAHLNGTKVDGFQAFDWIQGKLVDRKFGADEIQKASPGRFVEKEFKREELTPHLTSDVAAAIAGDAYRALLFDDHSAMVHTGAEMIGMAHNAPLVSAIAEIQFARLQGLTASPGTSCCCCSCCCWGSCSSCA